MAFHSEAVSTAKRFSIRFGAALLIPTVIVCALLYVAANEEENLHNRNLRWLAQMAAQIHDRIQNHSNLVRDRAENTPAVTTTAGDLYSIETLKPADGPCVPEKWGHLTVVDTTQERQIRFAHSRGERKVCAYSDLKELVQPALRKDAFTSVVLAQRSGKVLYQFGPESLRITNVSFLFTSPVPGPGKAGSKSSGEASIRSEPPTASVHLTSLIGDTKYAVFVQPLPTVLRADPEPKESDWLLIGLLEDKTLLPSTAPNDMMVLLPVAVLLAAVSWPLHKLWTLSPLDPLRPREIGAIVVCSLAAMVLLTLLCVSEYFRHSSKIRADAQLRRFANALGANFRSELKRAVVQIYQLDHIAVAIETGDNAPVPTSAGNPQTRSSILADFLKPGDVQLPFEYADWIDANGDKNIRWTTGAVAPQVVKVADRSYFRDVLSRDTLTLAELPKSPFAIEQVLSRTSGHAVTMIAIPSVSKINRVASLAVDLVSLADPVAPRDLGFAIIDATGKVLFHSERSRMFVENFFDECGQSKALRGLVSRRVPAYLDVDYGANPHRIFVTPFPDLERIPWTMITFRKLSANRVGRMQVLADTSLLILAYGAIISVAMFIALRVARTVAPRRRGSTARWWTACYGGYPYTAAAGVPLLVILWRALDRAHGVQLFTAAVAGAVSFLLINALSTRRPAMAGDWNTSGGRRRLLTLTGIPAILCCVSVIVGDRLMMALAPAFSFAALLAIDHFNRSLYRKAIRNIAWPLWGAQVALALCIGPTLMLSRMSSEFEMRLRLRDAQWKLWDAEAQRRKTVLRTIEAIPQVPANTPEGAEHGDSMTGRLLTALGMPEPDLPGTPIYYYGSETSRILLTAVPNAPNSRARSGQTRSNAGDCPTTNPASEGTQRSGGTSLLELVLATVELPNEDDRLMGFDTRRRRLEPADNLWTWYEHDRVLCMYSDRLLVAQTELPEFRPLRGSSGLLPVWPGWAGLIGLLITGVFWMVNVRERLLLRGVGCGNSGDVSYELGTPVPRRVFFLMQPGYTAEDLPKELSAYSAFDLAKEEFHLAGAASVPDHGLLLLHFEARLGDPAMRNSRLGELETALRTDKPIAIVSSIDCLRYVEGSGEHDGAAENAELSHWCTVFNYFERRLLPTKIRHGVRPAAIWDTCSDQEKIVLRNISGHGIVNPRSAQIVCRLVERGLLCRTRDLRIYFSSAAFRAFVASLPASIRPRGAGGSARQRLPAVAIGLVLLGFVLFVSQEEVTTRLIGFLTTVTGGFEAIRKQLAAVQGDFGGSKKV